MRLAAWPALIGLLFLVLAACGTASSPGAAKSPPPAPSRTSVTPVAPPTSSSTAPSTSAPTSAPASTAPPSASPQPSTSGIPAWLAGTDWTYIPTNRKVVALTFDAGANDDGVASILATLQAANVPATFFLTGNFVKAFPSTARRIAAAGYRIGNHTITHPYLTRLSDAAIRHEILGAAQQIIAVTGANPAPLFRFPYGDENARTIAIVNQVGYVPVRWTVDTLGWEGTAGHITASVVVARVLSALRPGEIVLMHVGSNPDDHTTLDADALPRIISELTARGYSFVTLDALVG